MRKASGFGLAAAAVAIPKCPLCFAAVFSLLHLGSAAARWYDSAASIAVAVFGCVGIALLAGSSTHPVVRYVLPPVLAMLVMLCWMLDRPWLLVAAAVGCALLMLYLRSPSRSSLDGPIEVA